jgi:hypothetical protein
MSEPTLILLGRCPHGDVAVEVLGWDRRDEAMTQKQLQSRVLATLRTSGRTRPAALVERVAKSTKASHRDVEEALHELVDRRQVALTWHGELEADQATK